MALNLSPSDSYDLEFPELEFLFIDQHHAIRSDIHRVYILLLASCLREKKDGKGVYYG